MATVVICKNSFDLNENESFDVPEVGSFLYSHFRTWPSTAKIYQGSVASEHEIPIKTPDHVYMLNSIVGKVYVVIYPAGMIFASALLLGATAAIQVWSKKKKSQGDKQAAARNVPQGSPNNSLSERSNTARINQRIPDIYGTVRCVPDMLIPAYRFYEDNKEYEHSYLCVGRGGHVITDIKDDQTGVENLSNLRYAIYQPYDSPNDGTPQEIKGNIDHPFIATVKAGAVNDIKLPAPNAETTTSKNFILGIGTDGSLFLNSNGIDLRSFFSNGDSITIPATAVQLRRITSYRNEGGYYAILSSTLITTLNFAGTYTIATVSKYGIVLSSPATINAAFTTLFSYAGNWWGFEEPDSTTYFLNANTAIYSYADADTPLQGPFVLESANGLLLNFNAPQGLYKDDGTDQFAETVNISVKTQRLNADNSYNGSQVTSTFSIVGSSGERNEIGYTHSISLGYTDRVQVTVERTSDTDTAFDGEVVDEVFLKALYGTKPITQSQFGNVTTIRVLANTKQGSTSTGDRKFNCLASRKNLIWDGEYFQPRAATSSFVDIVMAVCLDPFIGNLQLEDIDTDSLWQAKLDIEDYFGADKVTKFNHTFDDDNLSFEEILSIICETVFVTAYRQGTVIKFFFEKSNPNSTILFNHRNKLPNSETRSIRFGRTDDKDGVEIQYTEAKTGNPKKIYIPEDRSAKNPESVVLLGVTDRLQAYLHAWRIWNRLQYQTTAIEFDATQEANLLNLNERILVADNTRTNTFDGEVVSQTGNVLTLSTPFTFEPTKSYAIFLQNVDGTIQSIGITPGANNFEVVLAASTNLPLALDLDLFARTTYEIVEFGSSRQRAFLVEEKTPKDSSIVGIKAVNYDERYYANDKDFDNGIVDANGIEI